MWRGGKGSVSVRYENRGRNIHRLLFRRSKHCKQIRQSNNSRRKQFFLFFLKTGLLQYNTTNKGSRPEIQDDPGERGERKENRRSSTPPTRDSAPRQRRTFVEINFRREMTSSKIQHRRCEEEE